MKRTTLSFLTESKVSHVSLLSIRRVAITLLVMLLTTASAWAQFFPPTKYYLYLNPNYPGEERLATVEVDISEPTTTYTLTSYDEPTREGYIFEGWSTSPTGKVEYKTGDPVELTGNLTLYAVWDDNPYTLTLDDNYEGGASEEILVLSYSPTYTLMQSDVPTREGHTFCGWSETPTGYIQYEANNIVKLSGNLTLYALWDDSPNLYKLTYTITSENLKQAKVSGYEVNKPTGVLDIPATAIINGTEYSVTSIGDKAFGDCYDLQSVTIPNSVTSIESNAFSRCSGLTSITVEEGNTYYDSRDNCNAIIKTKSNTLILGCKNTIIPNSVTSIGSYAFYGCSSLESITIPNSVTSIGNFAFADCGELTSVNLNSNPWFDANAFKDTPATVTMNLTASNVNEDKWTTFYSNSYNNFQADENTTVYKATVDGSSLVLTEVEDKIVNRETAVILKSSGNPVMTLTNTSSSDTNDNDLCGISGRLLRSDFMEYFSVNAIYTMGNTSAGFGFHKYTGEYVPAGKAFLPLNTSNGAKAQSLTIVFAIGATGIKSVSSDSNVQNDWFSLDGTRLSGKPSQPGIYVNGKKKIVIK